MRDQALAQIDPQPQHVTFMSRSHRVMTIFPFPHPVSGMNKNGTLVTLLAALLVFPTSALAGKHSDKLAVCVVESATSSDKATLVQWMFASASLHPQARRYTQLSKEERTRISKRAAKVIENLLADSCPREASKALDSDGGTAFEVAFAALGAMASQEMFSHSDVEKGTGDLGKWIDSQRVGAALDRTK